MASTGMSLDQGHAETTSSPRCAGSRSSSDSTSSHNVYGCIRYLRDKFTALCASQDMERASMNTDLNLELVDSELSNVLCGVRSLRNATLPIMRLPPEVLGTIFELVRAGLAHDIPEGAQMVSPKFVHPRGWMQIRQVCRRWHDVADAHPALWTTIIAPFFNGVRMVSNKAALISLFLRHSRQNLLTLHLSLLSTSHPVLVDILTHLPRVRDMFLMIINPPPGHMLPLFAQSGAPALRSLTLAVASSHDNVGAFLKFPTLFRDEMPMLRSLEIRGFMSSALSSFRNLTQLRLCGIMLCHHWGGLARLLDNSASTLEDLWLYDVLEQVELETPPEGDPSQREPIQIPTLKKLAFEDALENTIPDLLGLLRFPASAPLFLHYGFCAHPPRENALVDLFGTGGPFGDANLAHLLADVTKVQIYADDTFKGVYASGSTFAFHFRQTFTHTVEGIVPIHFPRLDVILNKAQELWLDAPTEEVHLHERRDLIGQAHNATKLYCATGANLWIDMLRVVPREDVETTEEDVQVPCPLLRELYMLDPHDVVFSADFLPMLLACLTSRQEQKHPLRVLYIYRSEGLTPESRSEPPSDDVVPEASVQDWDGWQTQVLATLADLSLKVEFRDFETRPRMVPPAHCTAQSGGGEWNWQTWDAEY